MNINEHLLTCLSEEAAEIIKATSKAQRFGLEDGYPGTSRTNRGDILCEINHLVAIVEMLQDVRALFPNEFPNRSCIDNKKIKIKQFMEYARNRKTLIRSSTLPHVQGHDCERS